MPNVSTHEDGSAGSAPPNTEISCEGRGFRDGADLVSCISLLGRPSRGRECLLEYDDLTRVIQVVLRRAGELGVRRVLGAQLLQKALHREGAHGTLQLLIQFLQGLLAFAPSL